MTTALVRRVTALRAFKAVVIRPVTEGRAALALGYRVQPLRGKRQVAAGDSADARSHLSLRLPGRARGAVKHSPPSTLPLSPRGGRREAIARRGLALLDVTVSVAASAVLFAGMASAVMLSLRAGDESIGSYRKTHSAAEAALQLTREAQHATAFNSAYSNATRIEFTIPDQTGDGNPETVRYSWSGVAGDSLYRTFNGGTAQEALANVQSFSLRYRTKTVAPPPVLTEGSETQLLDQSGSIFFALSQNVSASGWIGEYFQPTLPAGTVSWRITRAQLYMDKTSSAHGITLFEVRKADASSKPTALLGQSIAAESEFSGNWYTVTFANAGPLLPSDGACVVAANGNGTSEIAGTVRYSVLTSTTSSLALSTSDGGSTWTTSSNSAVWLRVWGKCTTQSAGTGTTHYYRTGVDVALRTGTDTLTTAAASATMANQPEVSGP